MSTKDDGGAAFPMRYMTQNQGTGETVICQGDSGMSLRDYFAAMAMQAILTGMHTNSNAEKAVFLTASKKGCDIDLAVAAAAYQYADYMIEARVLSKGE